VSSSRSSVDHRRAHDAAWRALRGIEPRHERSHNDHDRDAGRGCRELHENAAEVLSESEFNRYYIRALARRAIEDGIAELVVYRAKQVNSPRPESEALVETTISPEDLLEDLRSHPGDEPPSLGVPSGPNSGLSVRLP
jgi:hypothetical protein